MSDCLAPKLKKPVTSVCGNFMFWVINCDLFNWCIFQSEVSEVSEIWSWRCIFFKPILILQYLNLACLGPKLDMSLSRVFGHFYIFFLLIVIYLIYVFQPISVTNHHYTLCTWTAFISVYARNLLNCPDCIDYPCILHLVNNFMSFYVIYVNAVNFMYTCFCFLYAIALPWHV